MDYLGNKNLEDKHFKQYLYQSNRKVTIYYTEHLICANEGVVVDEP
jgi:hypothetical protein